MTTPDGKRRRAVVTGASSGIGTAFAERLASDHYNLTIVARRRERLQALGHRLREKEQVDVQVVIADLNKPADLHALEERLAGDEELELLVNSAGFSASMPFVTLDPDRAEEMINVQVLAVTRLTRAALAGMIARGRGAIINVSSRLTFTASMPSPPLNKRAVYAATKAYINTFTEILHDELKGTGVQVQALCPGIVWTEFYERQGMKPGMFPPAMLQKPEEVVAASLAGLKWDEVICVPALDEPELLQQIDESERRVWDHSTGGAIAKRYTE
jgi:short-subunit dehydrogenase